MNDNTDNEDFDYNLSHYTLEELLTQIPLVVI